MPLSPRSPRCFTRPELWQQRSLTRLATSPPPCASCKDWPTRLRTFAMPWRTLLLCPCMHSLLIRPMSPLPWTPSLHLATMCLPTPSPQPVITCLPMCRPSLQALWPLIVLVTSALDPAFVSHCIHLATIHVSPSTGPLTLPTNPMILLVGPLPWTLRILTRSFLTARAALLRLPGRATRNARHASCTQVSLILQALHPRSTMGRWLVSTNSLSGLSTHVGTIHSRLNPQTTFSYATAMFSKFTRKYSRVGSILVPTRTVPQSNGYWNVDLPSFPGWTH